jgi:predicted anti-sigma-YlaC factor YlaD
MQPKMSGHWTNDQLVAHLYGVGPESDHLAECSVCRSRLAAMQSHRELLEFPARQQAEVSAEFLAAQRRQIYARIEQPMLWWSGVQMRRWASAAATLLVLSGGLVVYEEHHRQAAMKDSVSDAQLDAEVSNMSQDVELTSTRPLRALFQ